MSEIFNQMIPKVISPRVHSVLDVLTAGAFVAMTVVWWRRRRRAALAALANGAFVTSYSARTDYDGSGRKPISFKTHGRLDTVQAAMADVAPRLLGFAEEKPAMFFRGQALNEATVIALTDFEANERFERRPRLERVA